jgi:hypothetical protein
LVGRKVLCRIARRRAKPRRPVTLFVFREYQLLDIERNTLYMAANDLRLSKYKVLIDCVKKSVKLTTLEGKEIEFITEPMVTTKGITNRAKVNQLDVSQRSEVSVVNEFPDVFTKELLRMPPDRDIKFVIELKPGTTPIYKTPYKMATPKLAKLKEHIKKLLEK